MVNYYPPATRAHVLTPTSSLTSAAPLLFCLLMMLQILTPKSEAISIVTYTHNGAMVNGAMVDCCPLVGQLHFSFRIDTY